MMAQGRQYDRDEYITNEYNWQNSPSTEDFEQFRGLRESDIIEITIMIVSNLETVESVAVEVPVRAEPVVRVNNRRRDRKFDFTEGVMNHDVE